MHFTGGFMPDVSELHTALLRNQAEIADRSQSGDARMARLLTEQADLIRRLAAAPIEKPEDLLVKARVCHKIARDEAEDGPWLDGRLLAMCAAVAAGAAQLANAMATDSQPTDALGAA